MKTGTKNKGKGKQKPYGKRQPTTTDNSFWDRWLPWFNIVARARLIQI